jgi:hypothetical protein
VDPTRLELVASAMRRRCASRELGWCTTGIQELEIRYWDASRVLRYTCKTALSRVGDAGIEPATSAV